MFDAVPKHWRGLAKADFGGRVSFCRVPTVLQDRPEFVAPFDTDSPVTRAGLRLDHGSTLLTPCPFAAMFRQSRDAAAYARAFIPSVRSWSRRTFLGALSPARPQGERPRSLISYIIL